MSYCSCSNPGPPTIARTAAGAGRVGMRERVVGARVRDQAGEERRVGEGELAQRLGTWERHAPIHGEEEARRGRLHAVCTLAEVHRVQVLLEDLGLRVLLRDLDRERDLLELALQVTLRAEHPVLHQ